MSPAAGRPALLFLVRHGESAWNAARRLQGQSDPELSENGRAQARALADVVAGLPVDGALSSDLVRAQATGELAGRPAAETDPRWRERALGEWEGHLEADVPGTDLAAFRREAFVPAGGETWEVFQGRVGEAVEDLAARGGSWLVYTHGGSVRAAVAHVTGAAAHTIAGPANTSVTLLELAPRRRMLAFNWTPQTRLPRASEPGGGEIAVSRPT